MAGYSGTPLVKKLGIKAGQIIFLANAPDEYLTLVTPIPQGTRFTSRLSSHTDMVHVFSTTKQHLSKVLHSSLPKLKQDGAIWVSWPKKSANVPTDITEDTVRELAFPLGLVDIKVCAVDALWSGLKLVIRKELRKKPGPVRSSARRAKATRR
ncbi:MAG: DUF3052 family protein [Gammaproteobacteria bacterium]|nr:DUF3052 family protein [Gammaproteobacteria bacterium]